MILNSSNKVRNTCNKKSENETCLIQSNNESSSYQQQYNMFMFKNLDNVSEATHKRVVVGWKVCNKQQQPHDLCLFDMPSSWFNHED